MPFPIIDAHQHVWDPNRAQYAWLDSSLAPLDRPIGFDEIEPHLARAGVDFTVLVQSADNPEDTALMVETADQHREVCAIVGYAPLQSPEATAATIAAWATDSRMVGVRNLIHEMSDADWLLRDDVNESLSLLEAAGLTFDIVGVLPRHLEIIPLLSERHPQLNMVIDHLAKPPIGLDTIEPWRGLIAAAAENPRVYGKISGLYSATDDMSAWTTDLIRPFFEHAVDVFGTGRLMYGGDWPISILAGDYERVWEGLAPLFDSLDASAREALLGRTAASFYSIDPTRLETQAHE